MVQKHFIPYPLLPNHHPKMDVLTKTFVQIILAVKWLVVHSSTFPNQHQWPLPLFCLYPPSMGSRKQTTRLLKTRDSITTGRLLFLLLLFLLLFSSSAFSLACLAFPCEGSHVFFHYCRSTTPLSASPYPSLHSSALRLYWYLVCDNQCGGSVSFWFGSGSRMWKNSLRIRI